MKAIVRYRYGLPDDVLELQDIDKPMVKDAEVLVRVQAVGIHAGDWLMVRGIPYLMRMAIGLFKPKNIVVGTDVAGYVEAVGKNVKRLQPGDEVFGLCNGGFADAQPREDTGAAGICITSYMRSHTKSSSWMIQTKPRLAQLGTFARQQGGTAWRTRSSLPCGVYISG